jgi:hypothetical protein
MLDGHGDNILQSKTAHQDKMSKAPPVSGIIRKKNEKKRPGPRIS